MNQALKKQRLARNLVSKNCYRKHKQVYNAKQKERQKRKRKLETPEQKASRLQKRRDAYHRRMNLSVAPSDAPQSNDLLLQLGNDGQEVSTVNSDPTFAELCGAVFDRSETEKQAEATTQRAKEAKFAKERVATLREEAWRLRMGAERDRERQKEAAAAEEQLGDWTADEEELQAPAQSFSAPLPFPGCSRLANKMVMESIQKEGGGTLATGG